LPIRTAFLPLVQQAARYLSRSLDSPGAPEVLPGEKRTIALGADPADEVIVDGPNGLRVRFAGEAVRREQAVPFVATHALGIYKVTILRAGRSEAAGAFAVNPPPAESDLAKLEPAQVARLAPKSVDEPSALTSSLARTALWPWLALGVLV